MQTITIDLNSPIEYQAIEGEHNADALSINLSSNLQGYPVYVIRRMDGYGRTSDSPRLYAEDNTITMPLTEDILRGPKLRLQVIGLSNDGTEISKSQIIEVPISQSLRMAADQKQKSKDLLSEMVDTLGQVSGVAEDAANAVKDADNAVGRAESAVDKANLAMQGAVEAAQGAALAASSATEATENANSAAERAAAAAQAAEKAAENADKVAKTADEAAETATNKAAEAADSANQAIQTVNSALREVPSFLVDNAVLQAATTLSLKNDISSIQLLSQRDTALIRTSGYQTEGDGLGGLYLIKSRAAGDKDSGRNMVLLHSDTLNKDFTAHLVPADGVPAKSVNISEFVIDGMTEKQISDIIISVFSDSEIATINIDKNVTVLQSITIRDGVNIYSSNGSSITFKGCDGFKVTEWNTFALHDLLISGDKTPNTTLLKCTASGSKGRTYNLSFRNGCNAISIEHWLYNLRDIDIWHCTNVGLKITGTDNTFSNVYINCCDSYGVYMSSSNNRLENFKLLGCGKEVASAYFSFRRNFISGFEIQDIWFKCAEFDGFNDNICDFNFDAARTNINNADPITVVSFKNSSNNYIRMISSKYGSSTQADKAEPDIIQLDKLSVMNKFDTVLSNVKIAGGLTNSYGNRNSIKLPEKGIEDEINFNLLYGSRIETLPAFAVTGFVTSPNESETGGFRFKFPKEDTRYLIHTTLKVDKPCTVAFTNQMPMESGKKDSTVIKMTAADNYITMRVILRSGNQYTSSAFIVTSPNVTTTIRDIHIYELDELVTESDLYDCEP